MIVQEHASSHIIKQDHIGIQGKIQGHKRPYCAFKEQKRPQRLAKTNTGPQKTIEDHIKPHRTMQGQTNKKKSTAQDNEGQGQ